jgi:hypothetical protein
MHRGRHPGVHDHLTGRKAAFVSASAGASRNPLRRTAATTAARLPWLVDAYRFARNPRWQLDLRQDMQATRDNAAFLRSLPPVPADAPTALVGLYRDNVYETKLGLVLASALSLEGMQPVVAMPSNRAQRIRRYAKAFGIDRVLAYDSLQLTRSEHNEVERVCDSLLSGAMDFDAIKAWTFRGHAAGNHVLSSLIRVTFDGSPDLALGRNVDLLRAITQEVLTNVVRYERVFDEVAPRLVLVEEANYSINGPLVDVAVARDVDVIQTIGLWREDALMSKRLARDTRRVDAKSVSSHTLAAVEREAWTAADEAALDRDFDDRYGRRWMLGQQFQPDTEAVSDEQIVAETGVDPAKPTAVIFAHVLWDASLFFGVDLFANYSDWLVQTVRAAIANPNLNWVVKAHPSNVFRTKHGDVGGESSEVLLVREHFPELPPHVHLLLPHTKISTLSLYRFADHGVTVRGTPGMEIACFGKPAITAGTGSYSGLGFTYDSESTDEYLDRLANLHTYGPLPGDMRTKARQYATALFLRRPWPTRSFELVFDFADEGWHPIDRNVRFSVSSVDELRDRGDLTPWARWARELCDSDFLMDRLDGD